MEGFKKRTRFIMVFFDNMPEGITLVHGQMLILSKMEKDNTLRPSKHILEAISNKHNVPLTTLINNLKALKRDKVIIPVDKALYMVNPYLFTRSTTKGGMLTALERQWDDLKFKYVQIEKDKEIDKLKNNLKTVNDALSNVYQELTLNAAKKILSEDNNA